MESMGFFVEGGFVEGFDEPLRKTHSLAQEAQRVGCEGFLRKEDELIRMALRIKLGREPVEADSAECNILVKQHEQVIYYRGEAVIAIGRPQFREGEIYASYRLLVDPYSPIV